MNKSIQHCFKMKEKRQKIGSIPIDGGMIVIGGEISGNVLKSSQIIFSNGSLITEQKGHDSIYIKFAQYAGVPELVVLVVL